MRAIATSEEYRNIRGSVENMKLLAAARLGNKLAKSKLVQMNYSCYPGDDGRLKGSK